MASITKESNGNRVIQFVAGDGKRRSIRLGKLSQRKAEGVKLRVEDLNTAKIAGLSPSVETAQWLQGIGQPLLEKLAAVGLISKRESATLEEFLQGYFNSRRDVKGSTTTVWRHTHRCLLEYFGANKPLASISPRDAAAWRAWLIEDQGLADNTVRRRCGIARQFFRAALRQRLLTENPFAGLAAEVRANRTRDYFVSPKEAGLVLDACPDAQWRLLFSLARYGGLRVPSEPLGLRWSDVNWERGRITVRSPKTEHHPGGDCRVIPIFPEIRPHLEAVWEEAAPGTEFIITRYRNSNANLRTQLHRIIEKAGLKPWPKLFQNLRSTRETELAEEYPIQVACQWIGNTRAVATKHYLQVTDAHFERALGAALNGPRKAVQNPVQLLHARSRKGSQQEMQNPGFSGVCESLRQCTNVQVGATGLEPVTSTL